ncbi:hypothetical protein LINPERPRIM_LOCUS579 [Linum perenne]
MQPTNEVCPLSKSVQLQFVNWHMMSNDCFNYIRKSMDFRACWGVLIACIGHGKIARWPGKDNLLEVIKAFQQ